MNSIETAPPAPHLLPFTVALIPDAVRLSAKEGWPHRPEDWELIAAISDGVVASQGARIVGTAFATPFGKTVAMINMIIVDESMRGRGLGRRLVEHVMAAGGDREMRLVATQSGLALYEKLGFVRTGQILQHQGKAVAVPAPKETADARADDWDAIAALDRLACRADRHRLFERLRAIGEAVVLRDDRGQVTGFALCRPFGRGVVIGPVVARDGEAAKRLIAAHLHRHAGAFVRVDTPATSGLAPWLADHALSPVGGGITMTFRGAAAIEEAARKAPDDIQTFALAAQALG
ncbi:GNAT family N-acetyltransferase [Jiella sp. MQZ9-1]|uniref:GNAT family N-acetyltransferase n=1 Tax=Jiella flava TaxID=2816857 RepID=A0A939FXG6_9HYPH|nr:GNAT family N-acetyltransferase [Jiella flava]MBO0662551.1 GNAT family N-acetyltransferase [Jiella flava]MCD2472922.1 GNAT family N-acetyltransferase [Jiella flava]